jgi:hypothetical protein
MSDRWPAILCVAFVGLAAVNVLLAVLLLYSCFPWLAVAALIWVGTDLVLAYDYKRSWTPSRRVRP